MKRLKRKHLNSLLEECRSWQEGSVYSIPFVREGFEALVIELIDLRQKYKLCKRSSRLYKEKAKKYDKIMKLLQGPIGFPGEPGPKGDKGDCICE
jgi:hypothetical protein